MKLSAEYLMHHRTFWIATALFASGCDSAPSKSQVVGTYSGALEDASEVVELRPDNTFSQVLNLPTGEVFTASGSWTLKHKGVTLNQYLLYFSPPEGPAKKGGLVQPKAVHGFTYLWGANMLIRDWDEGYYTMHKR